MAKVVTSRLKQTRWSSGQDTVQRIDFDTDAANLEANVAIFLEGTLANRPSSGITGRFYTVKNDPNPALNGHQYYDNGLTWTAFNYGVNFVAEAANSLGTALTVKSPGAPSSNIFNVVDTSNASLLSVNASGVVTNAINSFAFGTNPNHSASAIFSSLNPANPVVQIFGNPSQSADPFAVRKSDGTNLVSISAAGDLSTAGGFNTQNASVRDTVKTVNLNATGNTNLTNATVATPDQNTVGLTLKSFTTQAANVVELYSANNSKALRVTQNGTIATAGSLLVGGGYAASTSQDFTTTPVMYVQNTVGSSVPIMRLVGFGNGQSAKSLEIINGQNNNSLFSVDGVGNLLTAANMHSATATVGPGITSPTAFNGGLAPQFEVSTGTETGSYSQSMVVRHANSDNTAVSRAVGVTFKLSDESSSTETVKSAGIGALSTSGYAANPSLAFYAGGNNVGTIDTSGNLIVNGNINLTGNSYVQAGAAGVYKTNYKFANDSMTMGNQTANTMYMRADNFAWYMGGSHNNTSMNAGGGSMTATLTGGSDNRLTVGRLTLTDATAANSTTPMLQLGSSGGTHIQFSNASVNSYTDSSNGTGAAMYLQNSGGDLVLGANDAHVRLDQRTFYTGANRVFFGFGSWAAVGGAPTDNDWWFDATNQQIKLYNVNKWNVVAKVS